MENLNTPRGLRDVFAGVQRFVVSRQKFFGSFSGFRVFDNGLALFRFLESRTNLHG